MSGVRIRVLLMKLCTTPLTGTTMAKYSKNYCMGDASRFPSTSMTYSPPNNDLQLSTTEWMDDALPQSAVGGHNNPYVNMYM
jgi:hypothetical protein